jgi:tripartite-type tricarboxylate transporter receptor subunit TctC
MCHRAGKLLLATLCIVFAGGLAAQVPYPVRPVKIVVTNPPGAGNDTLGRLFAQKLTEQLGQSFIVENRPGGNGIAGADFVAKSAPDGHTLMLGNTATLAIMSALMPLPYDPQRDFSPIAGLAISSSILVVHPSVAARNVAELVSLAKASPGKLNYGSPGNGSPFHLSAELFKSQTGTEIVHVPYKGSGPALIDLMAGRVQLMFFNVPTVAAHIKSGKLRALVSTGYKRHPLLPEVPTMAEAGIRNGESLAWFVLAAPKQTPRTVVNLLNGEIAKVASQPDVRQAFNDLGVEPVGGLMGSSPEDIEAFIRGEVKKWTRIIRESGVKADG